MPPLLVDNDVYCKLGVARLLESALELFGAGLADCRCLPALQHMLRRGKLPKVFGAASCEGLVDGAKAAAFEFSSSTAWLDKVAQVNEIDPGEAQLFAYAAEHSLIVLTGDKRALRAVARLLEFHEALAGRLVTFEAILIALCSRLGESAVRSAVQPALSRDKTIQVCFSPGNSDPRGALRSYFRDLEREVEPLPLWKPPQSEAG